MMWDRHPLKLGWLAAICMWSLTACGTLEQAGPEPVDLVRLVETPETYRLTNGLISVTISKDSGDLISFVYEGQETLGESKGHPYVYWSHDVRGGASKEASVTIDPLSNGGVRAEVSIRGISGGIPMGHGPGTPPEGDLPVDIDIRYAIENGDSAVYTYTIFDHPAEYKGGDFAEARIAAKLDEGFTHIHVDDDRSGKYPLLNEGIDKYVYVTRQWDSRAYGWTDPELQRGWFMLIPSPEYLSGGPTTAEFVAHGTSPTVLSYWKSSHNGGANITLADGEDWSRVVGPIVLYANSGESSDELWADAKVRLSEEEQKWPYGWIKAEAYAGPGERRNVAGQLRITDTFRASDEALNGEVIIGLTQTPYEISSKGTSRTIDWQRDAKFYQHWTRAQMVDGRADFLIPDVPYGQYTLHAVADDVFRELSVPGVGVLPDNDGSLGVFDWSVERFGSTIFQIGEPDRWSAEFAGADRYFEPGQPLRYAEMFPDGVIYRAGASDAQTDWHYTHMPQAKAEGGEISPFRGVKGVGTASPRHIHFSLDEIPADAAMLRIAVNGTGEKPLLELSVNGEDLGEIPFGRDDGSMKRHQINGVWKLQEVVVDAGILTVGENTLTLTVPAGSLNRGLIYDAIRLEWDQRNQ